MNKWFPPRFSAHRGGGCWRSGGWLTAVCNAARGESKNLGVVWMSMQMHATQQTISSSLQSGITAPDLNPGVFTSTPQVGFSLIYDVLYLSQSCENETLSVTHAHTGGIWSTEWYYALFFFQAFFLAFVMLYGLYSWRLDRKQDEREWEWQAAKGPRPGFEPRAVAARTRPLHTGARSTSCTEQHPVALCLNSSYSETPKTLNTST